MAFDATAVKLSVTVSFSGSHTVELYELSDFDQQMRADLTDAFFRTADFFNRPVSYTHGAPSNAVVRYDGYFEDPSKNASAGYPGQITVLHPTVEIPRHVLQQYPTMADQLSVSGKRYMPVKIDDDGCGVVKLYLVKAGRG
jgi:hypothetical protein